MVYPSRARHWNKFGNLSKISKFNYLTFHYKKGQDSYFIFYDSVTTIRILFIVVVQILVRIEYKFIFLFVVDFVWTVLSDCFICPWVLTTKICACQKSF